MTRTDTETTDAARAAASGASAGDEAAVAVNIVGAGLAGLSAAIHLAQAGVACRLVSSQPSERAQSVLAEGGINGALNTMGEDDRPEYHFQDTMKAGCDIADPVAVRDLTQNAPEVLRWLDSLGVPFQRRGRVIQQRNFGGQKKKRTAYARSSTGKVLMTALIDEARRHEAAGTITRYVGYDFVELVLDGPTQEVAGGAGGPLANAPGDVYAVADQPGAIMARSAAGGQPNARAETPEKTPGPVAPDVCVGPASRPTDFADMCVGLVVRNSTTGEELQLKGPVIMACGGLGGLFPGKTTGTTANTGDAAARLFAQGVVFSNLEMIQYHPTTLAIPRKRLLVSEAARGEGGRLFVMRGGTRWYFMEEKYPELGNLMPRDVVSREEYFVTHDPACGDQVFLDCTGLTREVWKNRLPDLRREVIYYTGLDPAREPIPVEPGIHYFMGGIHTDAHHRTNIAGLYAAGECCSLYHGANRLGGNSTLGAVYGGQKASETAARELLGLLAAESGRKLPGSFLPHRVAGRTEPRPGCDELLGETLYDSLGVVRNAEGMEQGLARLREMLREVDGPREHERITLGIAMVESALFRTESRGAQYRSDVPQRDDGFKGTVAVRLRRAEQDGRTGGNGRDGIEVWLERPAGDSPGPKSSRPMRPDYLWKNSPDVFPSSSRPKRE